MSLVLCYLQDKKSRPLRMVVLLDDRGSWLLRRWSEHGYGTNEQLLGTWIAGCDLAGVIRAERIAEHGTAFTSTM